MYINIIILSNGDKVIGEVGKFDTNGNRVTIEDNKLFIKEPFILKEVMTPEGFTILPLPLVTSNEKEFEINADHIMVYPCKPTSEVRDMYKQMTSNILLPKTNSGIKLI
jgi:hypothetical protein